MYCVSLPYDDDNMFATAGECGAVFIWDVRVPDGKYCYTTDEYLKMLLLITSFNHNIVHSLDFNLPDVLTDCRILVNLISVKFDTVDKTICLKNRSRKCSVSVVQEY